MSVDNSGGGQRRLGRAARREAQQFGPIRPALDGQPVARQPLALGDGAQVDGEIGEAGEAARLGVQVAEVEGPALRLTAGVLAGEAVQPALDAAGEAEVFPPDGEHEGVGEDALVEPVRQDQLQPERAAGGVSALLPLVDPGEAVPAPQVGLAQVGHHRGRLEAVQCGAQALVVAQRSAPPGEGEDLVRRRAEQARGAQAGVARLDELAGGPDQHVGVPDGGEAVLGGALDADAHVARGVVDRLGALRLGQREERVRHQVLLVAHRHGAGQRDEQVELHLSIAAAEDPVHGAAQRRAGRAGRTVSAPGSEVEVRRPWSAQPFRSSTA